MSEESADYGKPLPARVGQAGEFYRWCAKGELRMQRCDDCGSYRHVPREMCAHCGSFKWTWSPVSGRGKVFTWTEVVRPLHPAFTDVGPYAPVVVELEEGVRLLTRVTDCTATELWIDMPVEVSMTQVTEGVWLPFFRRIRE